jgi:phosphoribosylformimino-5-aminoimidazole carboxamide ribotide isomerase
MLDAGVSRVILGTRALADEAALARLVALYGGEKIAVGIDARDGLVQTRGWTHTSSVRATDLAERAADAGVSAIIYTDTATDGMLSGPNLTALAQIADAVPPAVSIVASGGVSSADDILAIRRLQRPNLTAAIVGKALYDRRTTLPNLLRAASAPL